MTRPSIYLDPAEQVLSVATQLKRAQSERDQARRRIAELERLVMNLAERLAICSGLLSRAAERRSSGQ